MYFFNIVLCCLFLQTFAKPAHVRTDYYREANDDSYGDSDRVDSDDYFQNEQKRSSLKQISENERDTKAEQLEENLSKPNEEIGQAPIEKDYMNGDQADREHLSDIDVKRTADYSNGHMLFTDSEEPRNVHNKQYNSDGKISSNSQGQYIKHDNAIHTVDIDSSNRDRRQITNINSNESTDIMEISTQTNDLNTNEGKETAIRRLIKKLSKGELDELLQSLSEENERLLLENLIDSSVQDYDSINKREITKKAGANEEPGLVGNEQSDSSKIQGSSVNFDADSSKAPNTVKPDNTEKDFSESMCSKSTEASNSEKSNDKITILDSIGDMKLKKTDNLVQPEVLANLDSDKKNSNQVNKREINSNSLAQSGSIIEDLEDLPNSNNDNYYSESEDSYKLMNEESGLHNSLYKRDVYSDNLSSIKSLEESFPNDADACNPTPASGMVPLVRVKRTNPKKNAKKRETNEFSDLKVPFFSNVVENNDEDSEEGSEFQENGFFNKRSNFAKPGEIKRQRADSFTNDGENSVQYCDSNSQDSLTNTNNLDTDVAGLGSDTDAVLSGIEGVNDNIMYNSVARNKRTPFKLNEVDNADGINGNNNVNHRNTANLDSQSKDNEIYDACNNSPRYQENDAFGSLPRNYEEDLGRFKRIRRLKLLPSENNSSAVK